METYGSRFGFITLYKNDFHIRNEFARGGYWDLKTLLSLKQYIDPNKNILEIGGHCGTSTLVYASYLNENQKVFVYEPQKNLYNLLVYNINQNNLENKIIPFHSGVFCYNGIGKMNNIALDGGQDVQKHYQNVDLPCNFGGLALGESGEEIKLTTVDSMNLENLGFIHCDAQGSENFIFSNAVKTITKYKPVILYENNIYNKREKYLYDNVCKSYPEYEKESKFDIAEFCLEELNYKTCIYNYNDGMDTLLLP